MFDIKSNNIFDYFNIFTISLLNSVNYSMNAILVYYVAQYMKYNNNLKKATVDNPTVPMLSMFIYMMVCTVLIFMNLNQMVICCIFIVFTVVNTVCSFTIIHKYAQKTFRNRI